MKPIFSSIQCQSPLITPLIVNIKSFYYISYVYHRQSIRRFMVIDTSQFILVEPDTSKLGWGVVKFVCHLQVKFIGV